METLAIIGLIGTIVWLAAPLFRADPSPRARTLSGRIRPRPAAPLRPSPAVPGPRSPRTLSPGRPAARPAPSPVRSPAARPARTVPRPGPLSGAPSLRALPDDTIGDGPDSFRFGQNADTGTAAADPRGFPPKACTETAPWTAKRCHGCTRKCRISDVFEPFDATGIAARANLDVAAEESGANSAEELADLWNYSSGDVQAADLAYRGRTVNPAEVVSRAARVYREAWDTYCGACCDAIREAWDRGEDPERSAEYPETLDYTEESAF